MVRGRRFLPKTQIRGLDTLLSSGRRVPARRRLQRCSAWSQGIRGGVLPQSNSLRAKTFWRGREACGSRFDCRRYALADDDTPQKCRSLRRCGPWSDWWMAMLKVSVNIVTFNSAGDIE